MISAIKVHIVFKCTHFIIGWLCLSFRLNWMCHCLRKSFLIASKQQSKFQMCSHPSFTTNMPSLNALRLTTQHPPNVHFNYSFRSYFRVCDVISWVCCIAFQSDVLRRLRHTVQKIRYQFAHDDLFLVYFRITSVQIVRSIFVCRNYR